MRRRPDLQINRLALGVPYVDKSNIARWGHTRGKDRRCRGNTWFVPYETIQRRAKERFLALPVAARPLSGRALRSALGRDENRAVAEEMSRYL